jgi:hypothetical protein
VSKLGESGGSKRNLGERWQSLVDEPLEPGQRRSLITLRVGVGQQLGTA